MELLFELVFWLFQLIGELVLELVLELVGGIARELAFGEGVRRAPVRPQETDPVLACVLWLVVGAALGEVSLWLAPTKLLHPGPFPGVSLLVGPLTLGLAMQWVGAWQRGRGRAATSLASFHGAAALAFGFALLRVLFAS